MDASLTPERELSLAQSTRQIEAELQALGLQSRLRTLGNRVVSVQAEIGDSRRKALGCGKGYAEQARVGALYEALEHYLSDPALAMDLTLATPTDLSAGVTGKDDLLDTLRDQPDRRIACRSYTTLDDGASFLYPVALTMPRYADDPAPDDTTDYRALRRYSSSSGTAIGATLDEAVLHGLNECLERDAVSLFLLDHFFYQNATPLRIVQRMPTDEAVGRLWVDAEAEVGAQIVLLDISSPFCATTCLAFADLSDRPVNVFGSGTSLDALHAASRALTELVQLHLNASEAPLRRHLSNAERHLAGFARLQRCMRFEPDHLLDTRPQEIITLPKTVEARPLKAQIRQLADDLQQHGYVAGVSTLYRSEVGTALVNVVVPGLERFYIVSSGNVVVPMARGRQRALAGTAAHA
ncbi:YcaO-like family protein [Pseudomonas corrugata]|uniref:YcaO-like family protein n=1 Tax=Pseudomonas corrugata TaxID=47879 RepID=UPI0018E5E788|nr:YcaO-like family protein [Pseudomonas corrugata]MBI6620347.1 YcaO-like family protein [Pseudomonas corrugata]MBI6694983.1 YcaO-like family protein [Pseudomonas corrugata]